MTQVLLYAEDAGAVSMVEGLPVALARRGVSSVLLATGAARSVLKEDGEAYATAKNGERAEALLDRWRPRLVAVGTAENRATLGLKLVAAARRRSIPTVGLVDAYPNAAWRFRGRTANPLAYVPDWLLVPDAATGDVYAALGAPARRVKVVGYPHADRIAKALRSFRRRGRGAVRASVMPAAARRRVLVFVAESLGGFAPAQFRVGRGYTLAGHGRRRQRTHIALEEVLGALARIQPRPYVVLRLHPNNTRSEFAPWREAVDMISQREPALPVVYSGDVIVGLTSTLLFEAALMGRPTLAVLPRAIERAWLPSARSGMTEVATTRGEVRAALARLLTRRRPRHPRLAGRPGARGRIARWLTRLARP